MISSTPSTRISLLGKPALYVDGQLQPFGGPRKAIALLAYVLLHPGRALSRAAVAELFWPDEEDESARASLRRHLHRALSALPEAPADRPWVIADKVTLRFNPDAALEVDTFEFERLCAEGNFEAAVALYRGDYLEDFYDDFALPERERLRALQSASLIALVDERRRALDYPGAIAYAQSLLRLDPLREDAIRRLMSLRFAAGDRSGALADFEAFRKRLRDELATDPMPETVALREAIRSNDHNTLENGQAEAAPADRPAFPFTGRVAALGALRRAWEEAARGSTSTAIVSGEAGVGKSRLISELIALAESQGGRVMFGTTATIETEPYQPVAEALRGALPLLRLDRLEPSRVSALSSLAPAIRDLAPNAPAPASLEPERERQRLFDAVEGAFAQIAEKRPLLVVLEDLHWAGSATIDLLEFLVRRLHGKSALIVISFREEDVDAGHALRAFVRRLAIAHSSHIALGPLEAKDVEALARAADPNGGDSLARELYAATEGNALFVTELLRERLQGVGAGAVPAGIAGTVVARLDTLSSPARAIAETAAVVGVGFDADVVRQASAWSFAEVFDALDELLDRALVRASPQHRGDYAFSHQLVHAAIYATVPDASRQGLHRRVASTLERMYESRPSLAATVARHYDAAGFAAEAAGRYRIAARYALDVFAQSDAIALASRALELCTEPRDRFELFRLREEAAERAGDGEMRRRDIDAMAKIARDLGDDDMLGIALGRAAKLYLLLWDQDAALRTIAELRALGERTASASRAIEGAILQARFEVNRSDRVSAASVLAEAETLAAELEDDELAVEYWTQRAFNTVWNDLELAREYVERARPHTGEDRTLAVRVLRIEAQVAELARDAGLLRRLSTELLDAYREIGDIEGQATAHRNLASAAYYEFDVAANRDNTDRALALFERVQKPNAVAALLYHRGNSALVLGDFDAAEADLMKARSIWESIAIPGNACAATINLSTAALYRGDHARARELALEAQRAARELRLDREEMNAIDQVGVAERELGMLDDARAHLETALAWRREFAPALILESLIELIPVYLSQGERTTALAAAHELVAGLERDRTSVTFPAHGLSVAADAEEANGRDGRARELRTEAKSVLDEIAGRIDDERARRGYRSLIVHRRV